MPAKVTSKIAWRSVEQKRRARAHAEKKSGDLSSYIQEYLEDLKAAVEKERA